VLRFEGFAHLLRAWAEALAKPHLEHWMATAAATEIPELTAFVTKLRQDSEAVVAALELPSSQGQINRLKLVRRAMYGRAKFDLLRQRIL
jgi:transposase